MKKRIFMLIVLLLLINSVAFAASRLFTNATSTGTGGYLYVDGADHHTVVATFVNTSTLVLDLDGSLDNSTYPLIGSYTIDATDISNGYAIFHVNDRLVDYVRPEITTLTGTGATVTVKVLSKGP